MVPDPSPIVAWLAADAPHDPCALLDQLMERIAAAGVRINRVRVGHQLMHPEVAAIRITWIRGTPACLDAVAHTLIASWQPTSSQLPPAGRVTVGGDDELRRRLDDDALAEFPVLQELRKLGVVDYFIQALRFKHSRGFIGWSTDAADGFSDGELEFLRALRPLLTLRLELVSAYEATKRLLRVYLGQNAARRVLRGAFRRGGGELIRAVIWICDVRGFTTLVDRSTVGEVLPLLDAHFERVARPITEAGGEILKFIGDALLAIFPVGADEGDACRRALAAADQALDAVAADGQLRMGLGLHLGDVVYGNIGASDRLDFTVIGRAVNEVSRIESLCKEVGVPLLCTSAFAAALRSDALVSVGHHALRGVAEPAELFTLARLGASRSP